MRILKRVIICAGLLVLAEKGMCGAVQSHAVPSQVLAVSDDEARQRHYKEVQEKVDAYLKKHHVSKGQKIKRAFKKFAAKVKDAVEDAGNAIMNGLGELFPNQAEAAEEKLEHAVKGVLRRAAGGKQSDDIFDMFKEGLK